jgi:undecaprenyl-diphosphatase
LNCKILTSRKIFVFLHNKVKNKDFLKVSLINNLFKPSYPLLKMKKRVKTKPKLLSNKHKNILLIAILFLLIFLTLAVEVIGNGNITILDIKINDYISSFRTNTLNRIMEIVTFIANPIPLTILTIIFGLYFLYRKKFGYLILLGTTMLVGLGVQYGTKILVHRLRPLNPVIEATRFSFPSGHTMMSTIFFSILIYSLKDKINKKFKSLFITLIILIIALIGFSRIYLGVHWFSDIIAGFSIGLSINLFLLIILELIFNKK